MSAKAIAAVAEARKHLGEPNKFLGATPGGFDCCGLVYYCYKKAGVNLPRNIGDLINCGKPVSKADLKTGDLVFPNNGYVGLYTQNGKFIHVFDVVKEVDVYDFYTGRRVA